MTIFPLCDVPFMATMTGGTLQLTYADDNKPDHPGSIVAAFTKTLSFGGVHEFVYLKSNQIHVYVQVTLVNTNEDPPALHKTRIVWSDSASRFDPDSTQSVSGVLGTWQYGTQNKPEEPRTQGHLPFIKPFCEVVKREGFSPLNGRRVEILISSRIRLGAAVEKSVCKKIKILTEHPTFWGFPKISPALITLGDLVKLQSSFNDTQQMDEG